MDVEDGAAFVARASAAVEGSSPGMACYYDFALIDTFNGLDSLPDSLFGQGEPCTQQRAASCAHSRCWCLQNYTITSTSRPNLLAVTSGASTCSGLQRALEDDHHTDGGADLGKLIPRGPCANVVPPVSFLPNGSKGAVAALSCALESVHARRGVQAAP